MVQYQLPLTGKLPPGWHLTEERLDGARWDNHKKRLIVIASIAKEQDGKTWMHLSMSHHRRVPTYDELVYLKRHWAGEDRKCIMVLPKKEEHVNINPRVLHLFCCLDGDPLPDFTHGKGTI
jgi:hypothetical protein